MLFLAEGALCLEVVPLISSLEHPIIDVLGGANSTDASLDQ